MIELFNEKDFELTREEFELDIPSARIHANKCNAKLQDLILLWPVVYGLQETDGIHDWSFQKDYFKSHQARIAFIEEIKKEPCKHEPQEHPKYFGMVVCKHCAVELVAEWREAAAREEFQIKKLNKAVGE